MVNRNKKLYKIITLADKGKHINKYRILSYHNDIA